MIFEILNKFYEKQDDFLNFKFKKEYSSEISINNYVANLIYFLIRINNFSKCLDIGTLNGKSAMVMAKSIFFNEKSNLSQKIITIEKNQEHFVNAKENFELNGFSDKIEAHLGDAKEILEKIKGFFVFDLIFIDADKASYEFYLEFANNHLSENGLIILDNIFLHLKNPNKFPENSKIYQSLENIILKIKNDYESIIIPYSRCNAEDALCIARLKKDEKNF